MNWKLIMVILRIVWPALKNAKEEIQKALDEASEGGSDITKKEWRDIVIRALEGLSV